MNKRIDFSNLGGYPIAEEDFEWMQSSYRNAFAALSGLIGNNTIVSGMVETGGNVTSGWLSINGELVPFIGGTIGTGEFIIDETSTPLVFDDGISRAALFERVARFSAGGTYNYAQLTRPGTIKEMWQRFDVKEVDCDNAYIATNFDSTGLGIGERVGWQVCNGQRGTKNRGGRISIGYSDVTVDPVDNVWDVIYNTAGALGGEKKHVITQSELPNINLSANAIGNRGWPDGSGDRNNNQYLLDTPGGSNGTKNIIVPLGGSNFPHENRQPFIVTLFIQKL